MLPPIGVTLLMLQIVTSCWCTHLSIALIMKVAMQKHVICLHSVPSKLIIAKNQELRWAWSILTKLEQQQYGENFTDAVSYNGLWNTWQYLKNNNSWDSHVTRTSWDQNMNTFTTQNEAVVVARCLSRNRDENGDGIITANEVKWYVPTSEQLMGMYLGAKSLPSPLLDSENINFVYSERGKYHYSTSDEKRIWSEEGASVSPWKSGWGAGSAQNFRCVRNLGIDVTQESDIKKTNYPNQAFEYKDEARVKVYNKYSTNDEIATKKRIFVMSRLTDQNIRSRVKTGELAIHNNFEDGNKPAYAFQMAKNKTESGSGNQGSPFTITTWEKVIRSYWYERDSRYSPWYRTYDGDRSWCKNYTEEDNERDKGLWRAPNQREMMLMYIYNSKGVDNTLSRYIYGNTKQERKKIIIHASSVHQVI